MSAIEHQRIGSSSDLFWSCKQLSTQFPGNRKFQGFIHTTVTIVEFVNHALAVNTEQAGQVHGRVCRESLLVGASCTDESGRNLSKRLDPKIPVDDVSTRKGDSMAVTDQ